MKTYHVMWEIDLDASTPSEAARKALAIQRDPESIATVFEVTEHAYRAMPETVDLLELNEAEA